MLNENDYEILKSSFIDSKILFTKLNRVADQASELDYDESGLYIDDEETYSRHWLTLSTKIVDALSKSLKGHNIELLKNESLETRELSLNLHKDDVKSKLHIDNDALSISQIS